jgi:hypothetical protein
MTHLRRALAMVAVVAALLAIAALFKQARCSCSGGLPYGTIAITSIVVGAVAIGGYLAAGFALRRG